MPKLDLYEFKREKESESDKKKMLEERLNKMSAQQVQLCVCVWPICLIVWPATCDIQKVVVIVVGK